MLVAKIQRVPSRPKIKQTSFVIDFLDDYSPQERSLNIRIPISWEGLHALKESIDLIVSRQTDIATGQERTIGTHEFTEIKVEEKQ